MKKLLSIILCMSMIICEIGALAANGDIAGQIYATDIKTCINGVLVDSYNIGGKTVVIVEDITTQYQYWDEIRTLEIYDFNPERLVSGGNSDNKKAGSVVGNIYETDIKTYFRGRNLTSYSLDGKMAVVVEELGGDNTFSDIGGKYVWNESLRTLNLELMYCYPYSMRNMLEDKDYNIILAENGNTLEAQPISVPLTGGHILCEKEIPENSIIPITYKGEIIGYKCSFEMLALEENENGVRATKERQTPVEYYYVDKVEDIIFEAGIVTPTAEDWLNYFNNHTISTIKDSFETDEYLFLYMFSSYIMKGSDRLIKINKADGTKIEYQNSVNSENYKKFDNVIIDKENEKVYFHYDKDYVIDLKTDEVRIYNKLDTEIGTGSADGSPSEYEVTISRNSQYQYKLIADGEELYVDGFSAHEYYYGTMLPLAETFDLLNIKYSLKNDVLIIDTSGAKAFAYEKTENKTDVLGDSPISYLYVDKVIIDGEESEITYQYISGHFENTHYGRAEAKPYVCNGKVYINADFISHLYEKEEAQ